MEETNCWIKLFFFYIYYFHIPNIAIVIINRHLLACSPPHCYSWTVLHPSSRRPRTWWMPWSSQSRPPTWLPPSTRRYTARRRSIPRWCPGAWRPRRRNPWWRERNRRSARPVSDEARRKNTSPPSKPSANSRPWTPFNCTTDTQNSSSSFSLDFFSSPCYSLFSWSCILFHAATCVCVPSKCLWVGGAWPPIHFEPNFAVNEKQTNSLRRRLQCRVRYNSCGVHSRWLAYIRRDIKEYNLWYSSVSPNWGRSAAFLPNDFLLLLFKMNMTHSNRNNLCWNNFLPSSQLSIS